MAAEAAAASSFSPWGLAALGLGLYSSFASSRAAKKTAAAAAADAAKTRRLGRERAADTRAALGSEIKAMRTLRGLDMPAYQQAAQISFLQAKKGSERMARNRSMGRLAPEVRDAVFGGQFQQYVGREAQKSARYAQMTQAIFGMAKEQQSQVNQILGQADAGYAQGMQFSREMELEAGDPTAKAAGALAQGAALQAKQNAANKRLKILMGAEAGAAGVVPSAASPQPGYSSFPGERKIADWLSSEFMLGSQGNSRPKLPYGYTDY